MRGAKNEAVVTDCVRLRKLAWKSVLDFGKYKGCSLRQAFDSEGSHGREYIAFLYYNLSNISFVDEIITEMDIMPIAKPGTQPDMLAQYKQQEHAKLGNGEVRLHDISHEKKRIRIAIASQNRFARNLGAVTKYQMQAVNHGHGYNKTNY